MLTSQYVSCKSGFECEPNNYTCTEEGEPVDKANSISMWWATQIKGVLYCTSHDLVASSENGSPCTCVA